MLQLNWGVMFMPTTAIKWGSWLASKNKTNQPNWLSLASQGKQRDDLWLFPAPVALTPPACSKTPDAPEQTAAIRSSLHTPFDT